MLRHCLLLIFRNFKRNKSSFFINLIGLSTGLACALLIYLWINDELNVDKFHKKDNQLFQVMKNSQQPNGGIRTFEWTPGPLAEALADEMPEVEHSVTVMPNEYANMGIVSVGETYIKAIEQYVGRDFFKIFSYNLIYGDKDQVWSDKNAVVISDELAQRLFHSTQNMIGKTLEWNQGELSGEFHVSGVFEKPPANSTAQFDLLFTFEVYRGINSYVDRWSYSGPNTYILLKDGTNINQFNEKIGVFLQKKSNDDYQSLFIRKYSDKYLYGKYENGVQSGGRIDYVKLFAIIAFFIVAIASVNFMNLSTAKASGRLKEVGLKKAIGAGRKTLILQYLGESLMMAFLSLIIAVVLVKTFIPEFNDITGKHLSLNFDLNVILTVLGITFFTGLVSGSYPALYISGFNPSQVLRGKLNTSVSALWVRKGLVIFQFAISVILIVSVLVVDKQIQYLRSRDLGYDKDNIILFKREGRLNEGLETFLHELKNIPGVENASSLRNDLTVNLSSTPGVSWEGQTQNNRIAFKYLFVNYDLIETLGIELKAGRAFSRKFGSDNSKIIFNEAAIEGMGLTNPIGKTVIQWDQRKEIVGVVKNFHFESLYERVKPCFIGLSQNGNNIMVKIKAGMEAETIDLIREFYQEHNLGLAFDFKFLDDEYMALYESEIRIGVLSGYLVGIAIIISCLGLFGLATFTAERRRKEIGIRKVLGSTVTNIVALLSNEFVKLVLIANCIALPVGWYVLDRWLQSFAYRVELGLPVFIISGLLALIIAFLTVAGQAIKAAVANPIEALKYE